jgi:hypothetical protein
VVSDLISIYVFESRVVKSSQRYLIYPLKEYQEKLRKLHGKSVKVIVVEESEHVLRAV